MIEARHLFLAVTVIFGAWALWPTGKADEDPKAGASAASSAGRKHVIRVAPGLYMPGRKPNPGDPPLKALREVADEFERLHPDTKIEFIDAPTGTREWLVTQLTGGTAPEILNVNVEDVWQDVQKGWYVALDEYLETPNPFAKPGEPGSRQWWDLFKYQAISRGKAAPDGKMYCITFDMIETGIFYNKDIFRKLGLRPPKDWADFLRIQEATQRAGYIPMLVGTGEMADWGVDLVFDQLYRDIRPTLNLRGDPKRDAYLKAYLDWDEIAFLNRKGFFTKDDPRWREVFRILKDWRRFMPKDLGSVDMGREFVQGKGAMFWMHSGFVTKMLKDPDRKFDWGVFYPPPITKETSRFGGGYPMCVIGGAATQLEVTNTAFADTGDPRTSERLKRCVAFLQFLTLPDNCGRVVNEIPAMLPNTVGVAFHPALRPFDEFLRRDYTTTKWLYTFDLRFSEIMHRMFFLYLVGGIDEDEFVDWTVANVASATSSIVRRKGLDLSGFEPKWRALAPLRAKMAELPPPATAP